MSRSLPPFLRCEAWQGAAAQVSEGLQEIQTSSRGLPAELLLHLGHCQGGAEPSLWVASGGAGAVSAASSLSVPSSLSLAIYTRSWWPCTGGGAQGEVLGGLRHCAGERRDPGGGQWHPAVPPLPDLSPRAVPALPSQQDLPTECPSPGRAGMDPGVPAGQVC